MDEKKNYDKFFDIIKSRFFFLPLRTTKEQLYDCYGNVTYVLWSEIYTSSLIETSSRFYFTGFPVYDRIMGVNIKSLRIQQRKRVLIVLNKEKNVGRENWLLFINFYKNLIPILKNYDVYVRPHPLTKEIDFFKYFGNNIILVNGKDELVYDLVLVHWSTMFLEFVARGTPTILVNPNNKFDLAFRNLAHYGAIAYDLNSVKNLILDLESRSDLFYEYRSDFIETNLYSDDNKSTFRVVEVMKKLLEDKASII
jgi:hypothetical protein